MFFLKGMIQYHRSMRDVANSYGEGELHWAMQPVVWYCGGPTKKERKLHHEEVCLLHALCDVGAFDGSYCFCSNVLRN